MKFLKSISLMSSKPLSQFSVNFLSFCLYDDSSKSIYVANEVGAHDFVPNLFQYLELNKHSDNLIHVYLSKRKLEQQLKIFKSCVPNILLDSEQQLKLDTHHDFDIGCSKDDTFSALFMKILKFEFIRGF